MVDAPTLHQKIVSDIQHKIVSGEWPVGERIPYEIDLASHYGVSRMTVNKVLTQLARDGLIERTKKKGSFVRQPQTQAAVLEIGDIRREVISLDLEYNFRILQTTSRKATANDIKLIDTEKGQPLLDIACVHTADGRPFCLERRLIDLRTVPDAREADFVSVPPSQWLLSRVPWTSAEHRIHAGSAAPLVATALGIAEGTSCLIIERRTWASSAPVTYVELTYPGDRHTLVATFRPSQ